VHAGQDAVVDAGQLAEVFDLGAAARLSDGPVARGKQGEIWRLETTEGRWAVKVAFDEVTEAEVEPAAAFQEAARAAGVPTPAVRRTTEGTVLASLTTGAPVRVFEWVDLGEPDLHLDPGVVGAAVAAAHLVAPPAVGPVEPWYAEPVGAERWDDLVRDLRAAGAPFADRLAALGDDLVALEAWLEPPATLRTCHRDLWADNVLPTRQGGICLIDWDNSGPADPTQELACVLFEFGRNDAGRTRALVDAYREAGGPGLLDRRGDFSMLIAQLGHITETGGRDWLRPNRRSPTRAHAEAWVTEVLEDPHTPEGLDALLAAALGPR
jgi:Ser/Thr protein kinase RdoA (MazF antagonist)